MPQTFESALAQIPGLGGYLAKQRYNEQSGASELSQATNAAALVKHMDEQQREVQFRSELQKLGTNPSQDALTAVAAKFADPKSLLTSQTASADRKVAMENAKQTALSRLYQAHQDKTRQLDIAEKQGADKNAIAQYRLQLDAETRANEAAVRGGNFNFNTGMTAPAFNMPTMPTSPANTAAPVGNQPTIDSRVSPADIQGIPDPAERAAALAALQGGRFSPPPAQAQYSPALGAPAAPPQRPPQAAPQPSIAPPDKLAGEDINDYRGRVLSAQAPIAPTAVPTAAAVSPAAPIAASAVVTPKRPTAADIPPEIVAPRAKQEWLSRATLAFDAAQSKAAIKADVNLAGGRESTQIQRVVQAGNQASKDLENIVQLPITTSRGLFGGRGQGKSLFEAGKESLANSMTTQEVQSYNVLSTGFQRTLAAIESAGLATTQGLTHQMDAIIFKEGESNFTKLQKLAQIRQIVEAGMESTLANPRVAPETRKHVEEIVERLRKSVPFTQSDLIDLQRRQETDPNMTLNDVVKRRSADKNNWDDSKEQRYQELLRKRNAPQ